jgi:hypothetical protein
MPAFADRGCHVVSVTDPYGRITGFLDHLYVYHSIKILLALLFHTFILYLLPTSSFIVLLIILGEE